MGSWWDGMWVRGGIRVCDEMRVRDGISVRDGMA